jgi:hypothetical protein
MTPTLPSEVIESQSESGKSGMKIVSAERRKPTVYLPRGPLKFLEGVYK